MEPIEPHDDSETEQVAEEPADGHEDVAPDRRTEDETDSDEGRSGFDRWRRKSALGVVGTGVALGLQAVFAPPKDEVVIVASLPGEPPGDDERVRVILDPDDPTKSVAIVPERTERTDDPPAPPT